MRGQFGVTWEADKHRVDAVMIELENGQVGVLDKDAYALGVLGKPSGELAVFCGQGIPRRMVADVLRELADELTQTADRLGEPMYEMPEGASDGSQ